MSARISGETGEELASAWCGFEEFSECCSNTSEGASICRHSGFEAASDVGKSLPHEELCPEHRRRLRTAPWQLMTGLWVPSLAWRCPCGFVNRGLLHGLKLRVSDLPSIRPPAYSLIVESLTRTLACFRANVELVMGRG